MKSQLPNFLTLSNLMFGCMAIVALFVGRWELVPIFWGVSLFADFADGFAARALKVNSPLGKELDSLADMVTFGVLPGAILYHLIAKTLYGSIPENIIVVAALPGFLITLFSAIRLAKFNIDTRQATDFIGLATPSCTGYVVGLLMIYEYNSFNLSEYILNPYLLFGSAIVFSYLLIAEIPMFGFKFKDFKWKGNEIRFLYIGASILLLITLRTGAFSIGVLLYVALAIIENLRTRKSIFY